MFSTINHSRIFAIGMMIIAICVNSCTEGAFSTFKNISLNETADGNSLRVAVQFSCAKSEDAYIEYWINGQKDKLNTTPVSTQRSDFKIVLTNLKFNSTYQYRIVSGNGGVRFESDIYTFKTKDVPDQLLGLYHVNLQNEQKLPTEFKDGSMLVYNRETPGFIGMMDFQGTLRWYQRFNNTGVKVAHFTQNKTILSILAPMDYPTSYGNEILELSLTGDTIFHLKKGVMDFKQTIHHEILLNAKNQYVTLSAEEKLVDLRAVGGKEADTVKGDGILILDKSGKKIWSWSVFDALDPLKEKNILKEAKDWMHANSLFIDTDGNYIISFYNNGQIWKVNATNKKVMWKFGKGGDFALPKGAEFDQGHAVHINKQHNLMLFDNGTSKKRSQILAFDLNPVSKQVSLKLQTQLQEGTFTDRMGSAYLINDDTILTCVSKQNQVFLTDKNGKVLWSMMCANTPYRVEFIPFSKSKPYVGAL
ncbi:aryl-sulfate sulfotransferase [Pedobacter foliorum]|uniref:aryl-sulfate sulfotransferase n=1 Tax=Pedobacter foliorum TaxID=2739058 RepID=UPI0015648FBE|nr:aryl-sulfate sulfotransferase [Pedobacter foliorum]NRF39641.1 aryl-sulfate sulfotransferase [Pedobacter foliorum]